MSDIHPGFKGETHIRDLLTGYGQWGYHVQANNSESDTNNAWARPAFAGLKFSECRAHQRADSSLDRQRRQGSGEICRYRRDLLL
ncbi:porin [Raoultella terrigena]|uniref:porin n=1 Tax=Raoultella terrigena TaxID=577 RepID=UPI003F689DDE|nr:porin [Raoultella terrigena]